MSLFNRKPKIEKPKPRRGLMIATITTSPGVFTRGMFEPYDRDYTVEVQEIETAGNLTKVKVLDVSGVNKYDADRIAEILNGWQKTHTISWIESE